MNNKLSKKFLIILIVVVCVAIVIVPTIIKTSNRHKDRLIQVVEKRIIEASEKCWNNEDCTEEEITLKELYDKKYLKEEVNPISKKVYDSDSKIIKKDNQVELKLK